jgi:3-oxo-5alpha-steroid 4-dehydrogenase
LEQRFGQPWRVEARQGVVLSSGGFIFNRELVARHAPAYQTTWPLGSPGCDGSALRLGQALGAATAHLERASAWRFINPPYGWVKGILVNRNGERFCNEELYGAAIGHALVEQGGQAWLILDAKQYRAALREACFGKLWAFQSVPALILMLLARRKARSVAALAGKLGMRPELLESTLAQYSAAARAGADPVFGKSPSLLNPLEHAPFYALNVSADSRLFPCPAITLGGLRVDEGSGAVLDQQQRPIPGLYAAGRAAVGIASRYYVSGLSLADCIWSGRRAGAHAAFPMAEHGLIHEEITDDASR